MRAPPEAQTIKTGIPWAVAVSIRRVSFSPTTEPIEPPMKLKSMAPIAKGRPSIRQMPVLTASLRPVDCWVSRMRSA